MTPFNGGSIGAETVPTKRFISHVPVKVWGKGLSGGDKDNGPGVKPTADELEPG